MILRKISTFLLAMVAHVFAVALALVLMTGGIVHANAYDPLAVDLPASSRPAPVILWHAYSAIRFSGFPPRRVRSSNVWSLQRLCAYRPTRRAGLTL